jgi:hypothetical protein
MPVFFVSCGPSIPSGVLDHDEMSALLIDMHIVDGSLFQVSQHPDTLFKYGINKYQNIFQQHQTDSVQFKKSFSYYSNNPDQLLEIYEKVFTVIKAKSDSSAKIRNKADSLKRIEDNKINERLAKRAADSIARVNKIKTDSLHKKAKADSLAKAKKPKKKNALPRK